MHLVEIMRAFYSDHFVIPLPDGHRFPIDKYALLRQRLINEGLHRQIELDIPIAATRDQILRVHSSEYYEKVISGTLSAQEIRRLGFPWSPGLVERSHHSVGGTIMASRAALRDMFAVNLAGGTHHAHPDHGEGFCVFNDVAIAARAMQAEGLAQRVIILDCDVHQGDGTAAIFHHDPSVFTFSIHGAKNFPFRKVPGDMDVPLPDGCRDEEFLSALRSGMTSAMQLAQPDLAIYIAGADPYENDRLGRLSLSKSGLLARDHLVLEQCLQAELPVAIVMGGGYARNVEDTVDIHYQTILAALNLVRKVD